MSRFELSTPNPSVKLAWIAESAAAARKEAEDAGHKITGVRFVRDCPPVCPGVVCRCHEGASFCPAHGRLPKEE